MIKSLVLLSLLFTSSFAREFDRDKPAAICIESKNLGFVSVHGKDESLEINKPYTLNDQTSFESDYNAEAFISTTTNVQMHLSKYTRVTMEVSEQDYVKESDGSIQLEGEDIGFVHHIKIEKGRVDFHMPKPVDVSLLTIRTEQAEFEVKATGVIVDLSDGSCTRVKIIDGVATLNHGTTGEQITINSGEEVLIFGKDYPNQVILRQKVQTLKPVEWTKVVPPKPAFFNGEFRFVLPNTPLTIAK